MEDNFWASKPVQIILIIWLLIILVITLACVIPLLRYGPFGYIRRVASAFDSDAEDEVVVEDSWGILPFLKSSQARIKKWFGGQPEGRIRLPLSTASSSPNPATRWSRSCGILSTLKIFPISKDPTDRIALVDTDAELGHQHAGLPDDESTATAGSSVDNGGESDTLDEEGWKALAESAGISVEDLEKALGTDLSADQIQDHKRKDIQKKCTDEFERLLWDRVIFPERITATCSSIHVPKSTIQALKSASLSLVLDDQEEFMGALSDKNVPGVILYGLPGTGKTQLVQALAKECRAAVLSVGSADLRSKWVGEAEKLVRAAFSLARKLSPCIIFVDEADSVCGQRQGEDAKHERAFLGQFLQEWDGFTKESIAGGRFLVIMATNRPFDLDEAIIRRAPARVLVGVPDTKDREAILNIYLKGQDLALDIDPSELASRTVNFTGSDLRNLCIRALNLRRQERAERQRTIETEGSHPSAAGKHSIQTQLMARHFEGALHQIKPSVDPHSLARILDYDSSQQNSSTPVSKTVLQAVSDMTKVQPSEVQRKSNFRPRVPGSRPRHK